MANKTKAQLLEEIEVLENSLQEARVDVARFQRYEDYDVVTADLKIFHDGLKANGFDKVQAFELTKTLAPQLFEEHLRDERQKRYARPIYPRYR